MKNLESILKILEIDADDFSIDAFTEEFMSIPYQIEQIKKHLHSFSSKDKERYYTALDKLKKESVNAVTTNQLQEKIITDIIATIDEELHQKVEL